MSAAFTSRSGAEVEPRKGSPDPQLEEAEFKRRFLSQFPDPAFEPLGTEMEGVAGAAWDAYSNHRKSPRTRKAGSEFHDADYDLAVDGIAARDAIRTAQEQHDDPNGPTRILLISGSSRSEHTCPSELSKSWRLVQVALRGSRDSAGHENRGSRTASARR
jgi:hypothetical protein